MMMVTFTIDGEKVEADEGMTVLEFAQKQGIEIPTLCYHKALEPYGGCRLCLVEVTDNGRTSLMASCSYLIKDGIEIKTASDRVITTRKMVMELLLARCPNSDDVKALAKEMGVDGTRFAINENKDEKCVLCGLCVRICKDVMGLGVTGFVNRGYKRDKTTPFGELSKLCMTCGACTFVCPTDAFGLDEITSTAPKPIKFEFEEGLVNRPAVYIPFPQAVPKIPVIDKERCAYYTTGQCKACEKFCEQDAIVYDQEDEVVDRDVGAIVVATGFDMFDPAKTPQYGYGTSARIITGLEFERYTNASGPTGGKIKIDGKEPKKVAFISCVGSRDREGHEYCSRICCMYTAKHAHMVRDKLPGSEVTVYFTDMRAFGKGFEEFYNRVKEEGVEYRRRELEEDIQIIPKGNGVVVKSAGHPDLDVDLVVLATAVEPRGDTGAVRSLLKVSSSMDGFLLEVHPKLRPIDTHTDGIFLAGCCQAPRDVPDTVAQASGAASRVTSLLSRENLSIDAIVSFVNEKQCRGCGFCVEVCPYGAIELVTKDLAGREVMIASVNEALCKGCGSCAAACLSGAMQQKGFTDEQLLDALDGLVGG